jgi:hypothetical protein
MPSTAPTETFNTWKHNAIAMSAALAEAERVMVGSMHLEAIAETLCEAIYKECEGYITPFIPKGADDSLREAFHNIMSNSFHGTIHADAAYFARLDAAMAEFRRDYLSRWHGEVAA